MDFHIPAELLIFCSGYLLALISIIAIVMFIYRKANKKS
jgi:hypothetical protein